MPCADGGYSCNLSFGDIFRNWIWHSSRSARFAGTIAAPCMCTSPTLYAKLMPRPPQRCDLISPSRFLLPVAMVKEEQGWCDISGDECRSPHESQRR